MNPNTSSEVSPNLPHLYAVGDHVTRAGFIYRVMEIRVDKKLALRRINTDGTFDMSDTKIYKFHPEKLHPYV